MNTKTTTKYLRAIYQLSLTNKSVRQIDLALLLGYARSSVSLAIKSLQKQGLIIVENHEIRLTDKASLLAKKQYLQYQQLVILLVELGIELYQAQEYAVKLEENFDDDLIDLIIKNVRTKRLFKENELHY